MRGMIWSVVGSVVAGALTVGSAASATAVPGASGVPRPLATQLQTARGSGGERAASVDPNALGTRGPQRVSLQLADGRTLVLALSPQEQVDGADHWSGTVEGDPVSTVTVIRDGATVSAVVNSAGGSLTLRPTGSGHVLGGTPVGDTDDGAAPPATPPATLPGFGPAAPAGAAPHSPAGAGAVAAPVADPANQVDVVVGWTPKAEAEAGGSAAITNVVRLSAAATNDAFARSGISGRIRLAGVIRGSGTEGTTALNTAYAFAQWGNGWDNVSTLRESLRADIAVLLVGAIPTGYVGWGFYPEGGYHAGNAVVAWDTAVRRTFVHEVGHTLGASHDRATQAGSPGFFPAFGYGYVAPQQQWNTIMAYPSACGGCPSVAYFSNPTLSLNGIPLGRPIGSADAADNRTAINRTFPEVSANRYATANPTIAFVRAGFQDFIGYQTYTSEVLRIAGILDSGAASKVQFLRELANSDAWLRAIVTRMYLDTLGRAPDAAGLASWVSAIRSGSYTVAQVAAFFYSSDEFYRGLGGNNLTTWVTRLYEKLLGRAPDAAGLRSWVGYAATNGRQWVAMQFYQSLESRVTRVTRLYRSLLGRAPDPAGALYWAGVILTRGDVELAVSLAASPEYQTRANARF